jgi:hypothetical protein
MSSETIEQKSWCCPFCNQIASRAEGVRFDGDLDIANADGLKKFYGRFVVCPNSDCKKFVLTAGLYDARNGEMGLVIKGAAAIKVWQLVPESEAKVFPEYVPAPIIQDYREACLIRDLSPKASATLARRVLQGMISDFWAINKPTLAKAIETLEGKVDPLAWKAIDAVRRVGNIGAHMEKDINTIIEVEPDEASKLIWLIETLIHDWYVNRAERETRFKEIEAVADLKKPLKRAETIK